jgi:hypothetical protein
MSDLRDKVQTAANAYLATRYPGDLASQILPARPNLWPKIIGAVIASAAAAIIVMVLLNQAIDPLPSRQTERLPTTNPGPAFVSLPELPPMPEAITLAPTLDQPLFLPSLPLFPSLGDVLNTSNQSDNTTNDAPTTQESL